MTHQALTESLARVRAGDTMIALQLMEDAPKGQDIEREMGLLELQKIE